MTTQDHNKVIGIMHLIYGGFYGLLFLIFIPFIVAMGVAAAADAGAEGVVVSVIIGAVFLLFALIFGLAPILAGYGMLKRKRWAKVWSLIAAVVQSLSFPFGTALAVYSLWFHFGPGQNFHSGGYDAPPAPDWRGSLREGSPYDWEAQRASQSSRPREYTPPRQPPDWRS